jgi:hypothetical protein
VEIFRKRYDLPKMAKFKWKCIIILLQVQQYLWREVQSRGRCSQATVAPHIDTLQYDSSTHQCISDQRLPLDHWGTDEKAFQQEGHLDATSYTVRSWSHLLPSISGNSALWTRFGTMSMQGTKEKRKQLGMSFGQIETKKNEDSGIPLPNKISPCSLMMQSTLPSL